jgi:hypothetical protein
MRRYRLLEAAATRYLVVTILLSVIITVGAFYLVLYYGLADVATLSSFIDAVFKTIAVFVAAIWALNRYYIERVDTTKLKVEYDVSVIPNFNKAAAIQKSALLVYRIDIINIGKTVIPEFQEYLEINAIKPSPDGCSYEQIYRWPNKDLHPAGPIEPDSWSAINDAVVIDADIKAIMLYVELELSSSYSWNWHKTIDISERK